MLGLDSAEHKTELELVRYVKPSYIKNGQVSDEVFQLREDRIPPEEYLSFFHSKMETTEDIIQDVLSILSKRNFSIKKSCGFLLLNATLACEDINLTKIMIEFKECGYPHYGMYYLSEDIVDIIEAKTILIHHAKLYINQPSIQPDLN